MPNKTANYDLIKPLQTEAYNIDDQNNNMDKLDTLLAGMDSTKIDTKSTVADGDGFLVSDSAVNNKSKRILWSTIKTALGKLFTPLTRKINGKALSNDVTLTGADIAVSGSDVTSVSSALANKVNRSGDSMGGNLNFGAHQLHFNVGGENNFYFRKDPYGLNICDHDGHVLITFGYGGIPTVYGNAPIATATKPQEYALPLAAGIVPDAPDRCTYEKNQFGRVSVFGRIKRSGTSDDIENNTEIFNLPVGYRPAFNIIRDAKIITGGETTHADIRIFTAGIGVIYMPFGGSYKIGQFYVSFDAS